MIDGRYLKIPLENQCPWGTLNHYLAHLCPLKGNEGKVDFKIWSLLSSDLQEITYLRDITDASICLGSWTKIRANMISTSAFLSIRDNCFMIKTSPQLLSTRSSRMGRASLCHHKGQMAKIVKPIAFILIIRHAVFGKLIVKSFR